MSDPFTLHTLENGLGVVIERMPEVRSAAAGFMVCTGARDETPDEAGISHFLEHMMFKGTQKRNWRDITVDFDRMGSTYNAFTSEDRTIYYGWVRKADIARQMELLADMVRSTLPEDEFQMERKVILEEIAMSHDQLDHLAFDFLQEKVFAGHPLAWPILGYERTVGGFTRDQMWNYFQRRYAPDNMLLIVAGNVDPPEIIGVAEDICGVWPRSGTRTNRTPPVMRAGVDVLQVDRFKQQLLALTFPAVRSSDELVETAEAATTILGGDNSRFYWNIVQTGLSPRAGAHYLDYTDCGAVILFAACQPENLETVYEAMRVEAKRISREGVEEEEVAQVKNRRRTSLAVEGEAPYHRLTQIMDDMVARGAPRSVERMLSDVEAVSVESVRRYFSQYPLDTDGHLASVGPRCWPEQS